MESFGSIEMFAGQKIVCKLLCKKSEIDHDVSKTVSVNKFPNGFKVCHHYVKHPQVNKHTIKSRLFCDLQLKGNFSFR